MAETITLPRSGLVLKASRYGYFRESVGGHLDAWVGYADNGKYQAALGAHSSEKGTRDECIAWLDSRVLELRAALMPADARERVAKELTSILSETFPDALIYEYADAVLAALGGKP